MKNIIIKELWYKLPILLISAIVFRLCWYINKSYGMFEMSYFLLPIILCGLLFRSNDEIELIRTSKRRLSSILIIRYFITFLYLVIPPVILLVIDGDERMTTLVISLVTTLLFSTSFSLLFRVLLKNPYSTVLFSIFTHMLLLMSFNVILVSVFKVSDSKTFQRLSPYNSETIRNAGVYGNNRLIITGAALAVIFIAYLIMRRKEKYYSE